MPAQTSSWWQSLTRTSVILIRPRARIRDWKRYSGRIFVNADGTTDTVQVNSSSYQASPAIYEVGIVSPNTQASAAIQTAIANNDLATVQAIINGSYGSTSTAQTEAPETSAPETNAPTTDTPETSAPETNAPETDAPTTDAPTTDAPVQDPSGDMDDNIPADSGEVTVIG